MRVRVRVRVGGKTRLGGCEAAAKLENERRESDAHIGGAAAQEGIGERWVEPRDVMVA